MSGNANRSVRILRREILAALSQSAAARQALENVVEQGGSVSLVVHNGRKNGESATVPLVLASPAAGAEGQPVFRINGRDLTILRDLGIDPTRTLRRKKT